MVGIFPDRTSLIRLVGALLAERYDEWIEGCRYLGLDVLATNRGDELARTTVRSEEVARPSLPDPRRGITRRRVTPRRWT
ncbi:hypothetical protein GS495_22780 [Rhodococcus hoagii]|nr:hypothetical protein [Prescottella equi]